MSRRQAAALNLEASSIVGQVPEPDSPRATRRGANATPGRGSVTPGPESPTMRRRRETREQREAAATAAATATAALAAAEAAEVNAEGDEDTAEGTSFFNTLAANASNNEASTGNNHTQEAVEHIQAESNVVQHQQADSRHARVEDGSPVREGWNFSGLQTTSNTPAASRASTAPPATSSEGPVGNDPSTFGRGGTPGGGPSGSGPSGSGPSRGVTPGGGPSGGGPSRGVTPGGGPSGSGVPSGSGDPSRSGDPSGGGGPPDRGGGGPSGGGPPGGGPPGGGPPDDGPPDDGIPNIFGDNGQPVECIICTAQIPFSLRCEVRPCGHNLFHTQCLEDYYDFFRRNVRANPTRRVQGLSCMICRTTVTSVRRDYQVNGTYTEIDATERWPRNEERAEDDLVERMFWQAGAPPAGAPPAGAPQTGAPWAPPSDQSMRDPSPSPRAAGEAPPGWVNDEDRSDLSRTILKRVIGVYSARNRGYRLLLKSDSRNSDYPNLPIYDLEPQSRFPGKMQEWQDTNGPILQPALRENLRGRPWEGFEIKGVANVWQNIRIVHGDVQMPLRNAEGMVLLEPVDLAFEEDWYKISDVNAEFDASVVRPAIHRHRLKTGQHVPIAPITPVSRRRRPTEYQTRPLSEFPGLAESMGRRSAPTQARQPPTNASDDDLEAFYERQIQEIRERRAAHGATSFPIFLMNDQGGWLMNPNPYRIMALEASRRFHRIREERVARGQAPSESTL